MELYIIHKIQVLWDHLRVRTRERLTHLFALVIWLEKVNVQIIYLEIRDEIGTGTEPLGTEIF